MKHPFFFDIPSAFTGGLKNLRDKAVTVIININRESELTVNNDSIGSIEIAPYVEQEGETYMNERQKAHIEAILLVWRKSLMEEVDRTVTLMKDEASNFPDPADRASQEEEFSIELRSRDRERRLIKKIEDGLERLDDEDFGYCEACGIEIGLKRLEARPTATLCIDCKTLSEIKEKQNQG